MAKFRRGATGILVALTVVVLLVTTALAIDWGIAYLARQELQNFVDASALAGAQELPNPARARNAATDLYRRNYAQSRGVDPNSVPIQEIGCTGNVPPNTQCYRIGTDEVQVTTPYTKQGSPIPPSNLIHVKACRQVRFYFAPVIGVQSIRICAEATASATQRIPRGMVVLDPTGGESLKLEGNISLSVPNGAIIVNSSAADALKAEGNVTVTAQQILVTGGYQTQGNVTITPTPLTGQPPVPDPLASLPVPSTDGLPIFPGQTIEGNSVVTLQPGIYTGKITIRGNARVTFQSGIYILRGGMEISGNAIVIGNGVLLYNESGSMKLEGNTNITLSPPGSGTYKGIAIFQARTNTEEVKVTGNTNWTISGTVYLPRAELELQGNVNFPATMIVAWRVGIKGNASITITAQEPPAASGGEPRFALED